MTFFPPPLVKGSRGSLVTIPKETHGCIILVNLFEHLTYSECYLKRQSPWSSVIPVGKRARGSHRAEE